MNKINEEIERYVNSKFPLGKELVWLRGKYAGRRCVIHNTYWDIYKEEIKVRILVKTERKDGRGFIDFRTSFEPSYRDMSFFTTPEKYRVLYGPK